MHEAPLTGSIWGGVQSSTPEVIRARAEQPDRPEFTWDLILKFKRDFIAFKAMKCIDRKLLIKSPNFSNLALLSVSK